MSPAPSLPGRLVRRERSDARSGSARALSLIVLLALTLGTCTRSNGPDETTATTEERATLERERLPADSPMLRVAIYDPERASNGYTLTLHRARRPTLIDMNGRTVHSWPQARVKSRVRLLPNGSLLGLALDRAIVEYDWNGNLVWRVSTSPDLPHHDVIRLTNGNTLFPVLPDGGSADELVEVDREGEVVWRWSAAEHLAPFIDEGQYSPDDQTHINSIEELPVNRLHQQGDRRFRPGNILVSARNLDLVFVIDRASDKIAWTYSYRLDRQHEARMIPSGFPGAGNIMLFDNGYHDRYRYRRSRVIEIDPSSDSVVWKYLSEDFYSPTSSLEQPLSNGNVLISSSRGGRVFEITREGETVWQWAPPFDPTRPHRYAYDHTPQLAALPDPNEISVKPEPGYRHVDRWAYRFARRSEIRKMDLADGVRPVLATNNECRDMLLPPLAQLDVAYGIDKPRVVASGRRSYAARFRMLMSYRRSEESFEIFRDDIDITDAEPKRRKTISLADHAYESVTLCVVTEELGANDPSPTEEFAFWSNPGLTVAGRKFATPGTWEPVEQDDLAADEIDARREHLRLLGYVD